MDISPIDPARTINAQVQQPAPPQQMAERQQLIQAVKEVNRSEMLGQENELTFVFDRNTRKALVRVVNRQTNEVVLQIPPEYVLRMAEELKRRT